MNGGARILLLLTTALAGAALTGCMETTFALTAAKQATREPAPPRPQGIYKIGDPYQINGAWYYPAEEFDYNETGVASFYGGEAQGVNFHGRLTANGEVYDMNALTAAHQTLPMPSLVRVTNLDNGRSMVLRVNDRGPYARGRIIDVSRRAAQLLGFEGKGTANVRVQVMPEESRQLKLAMLNGDSSAVSEMVAALPRSAVQSDALPPLPGSRSSSVTAAPLPPPSQTLLQTQNATAQQQRANGRTVTTTQPLAKPAAPVTAPQAATPSAPAVGTSVASAPRAAPPLPREVAALPVQDQAAARAVVTQGQARQTGLFIQAGSFSNFDSANRLRAQLARYGATQISQVMVNGQQFFRVRMGPINGVQQADQLLDRIAGDAPQARVIAD